MQHIKIYEGGSEYADLIENMTGIHEQTKVSVPGNQMFVKFETSSTVASKGFMALIHRKGKLIWSKVSEKFTSMNRKL